MIPLRAEMGPRVLTKEINFPANVLQILLDLHAKQVIHVNRRIRQTSVY